jgi:ATP-dependent DNA ligase
LVYFAFDLLYLDGVNLRPLPLVERKATLKKLLGRRRNAGPIRYSDHVEGQGSAFFRHACRLGLEGIVSNLARSPYRPRRTTEWLKVKCLLRQEMVIGGWQDSDKQGRSLKSLLLGYYDRGGGLVFAGKAGTGFSLRLGRQLVERLRKIEREEPPFASVPRDYLRGSRWAEPKLVAEIAYGNWTTDGVMRHPKFMGRDIAVHHFRAITRVRARRPTECFFAWARTAPSALKSTSGFSVAAAMRFPSSTRSWPDASGRGGSRCPPRAAPPWAPWPAIFQRGGPTPPGGALRYPLMPRPP